MATAEFTFICWATMATGALTRIEVAAPDRRTALGIAFNGCPSARSMNCQNTGSIVKEARHG